MSTNRQELSGLRAVVTGSSSGIGRAIALELASAGANLFIHARRNVQGLESVANELRAVGAQVGLHVCDLAEPAGQDELLTQVERWATDAVDIWVNNAGADVLTGDAAQWSFEQKLDALWKVDAVATMRLSRSIGQRMKNRGQGTIVNIGWDQAEQGMAGDSGELFAATKGAVMAFTRSLARSLAPEVRVNCVAPGWIRTAWGDQATDYWQNRAKTESLLARWGTPEDVAQAVRFLASPAASFITGQILPVNGGLRI